MARESGAWRAKVVFVGYFILGLLSIAMAAGLLLGTSLFTSPGPRGAPRPWNAVPIDSPITQTFGAMIFALIGLALIWLGIKALRGHRPDL